MVDIGLDIEDIRHSLQPLIHGQGYISLASQVPGQSMHSHHIEATNAGIDEAINKIQQIDQTQPTGIWVRQSTIRELPPKNKWGHRERGVDELTASIIRLFYDVDCGTYHADSDAVQRKRGGLRLPGDEGEAVDFIKSIGLPDPTQIDFTGGGVNPYWNLSEPFHIEEGDTEAYAQAEWLYGVWQDIAHAKGRETGIWYGPENRDLSRLLRIPGTINRKRNPHEGKDGLADPSAWPQRQAHTVYRDGPAYSFAELVEIAKELERKAEPKAMAAPPAGVPAANVPAQPQFDQPGGGSSWAGGVAPGLDYRNKATAETMLDLLSVKLGWTVVKEDNEVYYVKHPDATNEHSATVNKTTKRLYVWSGSTIFPTETPMNPEYVWALIHGFPSMNADAARALKAENYGEPGVRTDPTRPLGPLGCAEGCTDCDRELEARQVIDTTAWRSLDDIGNGERVRDLHGDQMRHIGDEERWAVWDERRWAVDLNSGAVEKAKAVAEHMLNIEVPYLRKDCGAEPGYPEDYPEKITRGDRKGENRAPDEWLGGAKGTAAVAWFYATQERAEWLAGWMAWRAAAKPATALREHATKCRNMAPLANMLKSAASLPGITALRSDFDLPGTGVFVTPNVTLDTRTGETREHRQADWNTRLCKVEYDSSAASPLWMKFLERNIPDPDTRHFLHKLAGYAMTGDADQKIMVLLHSDFGDTGKSLFLNVLKATMGSDYVTGLAGSTLAPRKDGGDGGRDPDRHAMMGKRLLIGSEFRRNEPMDEAFMKKFTGRDPMSTRGNYSKVNTEWLPEGLIVIGTNKLFRIDLDDPAVWARIVVVPFMVAFPKGHPERDDDLERKITTAEREGVLAWLVEGLRLYRAEGLVPSPEVTMATANYKSNSDHVGKWIEAAVEDGKLRVTDDGSGSVLTILWEEFERWCKTERIHTDLAMGTFKKRLIDLGYPYGPITSGPLKGRRVMQGIELLPSAGDWQMQGYRQ